MVATPLKSPIEAPQLAQRIEAALLRAFPDAEVQREPNPYSEKVAFYIFWADFVGQLSSERHAQVWKALRAQFTEEELDVILAFHVLTPDEWRSINDDF